MSNLAVPDEETMRLRQEFLAARLETRRIENWIRTVFDGGWTLGMEGSPDDAVELAADTWLAANPLERQPPISSDEIDDSDYSSSVRR